MKVNYNRLTNEQKEHYTNLFNRKRSLLCYYKRIFRETYREESELDNALDKILELEAEIQQAKDEIFNIRIESIEAEIEKFKQENNL